MKRSLLALPFAFLGACASRPVEEVRAEEALAWRAQGDEAAEDGRYEEAIGHYTESLRLNPSAGETYFKRANAQVKRSPDPESPNRRRDWIQLAERDYSAAVQLNPALTSAWFNRAMVYMKLKRYIDAARDLLEVTRLVADRSDPMLRETELILGDIYLKKLEDELVKGMRHYDEYVKLGGNRPDVVKLVREWRELEASLGGKTAPPPKGPTAEEEAAAKELHAKILALIPKGPSGRPEIARLLEELTSAYGHTRYVRDNEAGLKALKNAFKPRTE